MRSFGLAFAGLLLAAASPLAAIAAGEPPISDATKVVDTLDVTTIGAMIAELGGQKVETREEGDKKIVTFADGDQPYIAIVTLCDVKPGKCLGLAQLALVDTSPTVITNEQINKLNSDNIFLTSFKLDGNKIGFGRVVLIDGGVTRANLAINVAAFVQTYKTSMKNLAAQLTSSLQLPPGTQQAFSTTSLGFHPLPPDPRQVNALNDRLLQQYRQMLTQGIRH